MFETRRDYLLESLERASEALAALVVQTTPGARAEDEEKDVDRALDHLLSGLDTHAHRLDPATLRKLLRSDERALAFAILQVHKAVLRHRGGDIDGGTARMRCAAALFEQLRDSPLAATARPLAELVAQFERDGT